MTKTIAAAGTTTKTNKHPGLRLRAAGKALISRLPAVLALLVVCGLAFVARPLCAQTRVAQHHTVDGTVVDAAKKPIAGAVVYLENPRSLDVQSYLSDGQGHFHFNQISPQTDYEVWAEQNGVETKHHFISQFTSHVHFHLTLKLTPGKKKRFLGLF